MPPEIAKRVYMIGWAWPGDIPDLGPRQLVPLGHQCLVCQDSTFAQYGDMPLCLAHALWMVDATVYDDHPPF